MTLFWLCRCGHPKSDHSGSSGPNSIGQWFFGQCVNGSTSVAVYRFGGCECRRFRRRILPALAEKGADQ